MKDYSGILTYAVLMFFANLFLWVPLVGLYMLEVPMGLAMTLIAYILSPVLSLYTATGWPTWGAWFWTPDNDPYGDRSNWTTLPVGSYWRRVLWLWRNPAYGFDQKLSLPVYPEDVLKITGSQYVNNLSNQTSLATSGAQLKRVYRGGLLEVWEVYVVLQWSSSMCFRMRLGWKIPMPDGKTLSPGLATCVFYINPFMGWG